MSKHSLEFIYMERNAKGVLHKAKKLKREAIRKLDNSFDKNAAIKRHYKNQRIARHLEKGEWQFLPKQFTFNGKTYINPRFTD